MDQPEAQFGAFQRLLRNASTRIASASPTRLEVTVILGELAQTYSVDSTAFVLVDDHQLISHVWTWNDPSVPAVPMPSVGEDLESYSPSIGLLMKSGFPLLLDDLEGYERTEREAAMIEAGEITSAVYCPIMVKGTFVAVVMLTVSRRERQWDLELPRFLDAFGALMVEATTRRLDLRGTVRQQARLEAIASLIPEAIVIFDINGTVRWASASVQRVLCQSPNDLIGQHVNTFIHHHDLATIEQAVTDIQDHRGPECLYVRALSADGEWRWMESTVVLADVDGELEVISSSRDAHERKLNMDRLTRRASVDELTGLANRPAVVEMLDELLEQAVPFSLLFCDLDGFKQINDHHGHFAGDHVLRHVAQRLQGAVRPSDVVARFGGDEFLVAVRSTVLDEAIDIAERIVHEVARPIELDVETFDITVSIGIAQAKQSMRSADLIASADAAMYAAKEQGRSRVVIHCV
jgi:diguanylate cyclase (GGDEF)-like protein/PAS domain S-box-containing protein